MNAQTATAEKRIETTETRKATSAEACFGAIMAVGALAGLWGAVSFMSQFIG